MAAVGSGRFDGDRARKNAPLVTRFRRFSRYRLRGRCRVRLAPQQFERPLLQRRQHAQLRHTVLRSRLQPQLQRRERRQVCRQVREALQRQVPLQRLSRAVLALAPHGRAAQQGPGRAGAAAARGSAAAHGAGDPVKSRGLVRSGDRLDSVRIYEFVRAHQAQYPIACMCRVLEVSTSGYYAWRRRPSSRWAQENAILSGRIAEIHEQSQGIYGSRRVHAELRAQGVVVSWQRVARLMRASGLQGVTRRRRVSTTQSDRQATVAPDRVERCFKASEPNQLWVADITYVPTVEGFLYLATVLDVFSRKVVGWAMSARQTAALVLEALQMAIDTRAPREVVFHSDHGTQYTALAVAARCDQADILRSMGTVGDCYDNALAESLFATVECELLQRVRLTNREEAKTAIFRFLEGFYNRRRRHSALGYVAPVEFERSWSEARVAAAKRGPAPAPAEFLEA